MIIFNRAVCSLITELKFFFLFFLFEILSEKTLQSREINIAEKSKRTIATQYFFLYP